MWALNLDWIINKAFPGGSSNDNDIERMQVYVVTAPRATNPNLHAQGGIFTTENLLKDEFSEKVIARSVNSLVEEKWKLMKVKKKGKSMKFNEPVMAHITLPVEHARKLLRLLNQVQISSTTLFPGYKGVADSLEERRLWDKKERATYWLPYEDRSSD